MRTFPEVEPRAETGVTQFGADWPGIFIRGDNALHYAFTLKALLEWVVRQSGHEVTPVLSTLALKGLVELLESCDVNKEKE